MASTTLNTLRANAQTEAHQWSLITNVMYKEHEYHRLVQTSIYHEEELKKIVSWENTIMASRFNNFNGGDGDGSSDDDGNGNGVVVKVEDGRAYIVPNDDELPSSSSTAAYNNIVQEGKQNDIILHQQQQQQPKDFCRNHQQSQKGGRFINNNFNFPSKFASTCGNGLDDIVDKSEDYISSTVLPKCSSAATRGTEYATRSKEYVMPKVVTSLSRCNNIADEDTGKCNIKNGSNNNKHGNSHNQQHHPAASRHNKKVLSSWLDTFVNDVIHFAFGNDNDADMMELNEQERKLKQKNLWKEKKKKKQQSRQMKMTKKQKKMIMTSTAELDAALS